MKRYVGVIVFIAFASATSAFAAPACMNTSEEVTAKNASTVPMKICHYDCQGGAPITKTVKVNESCPKSVPR